MKYFHLYLSALLLASALACVSENKQENPADAAPILISVAEPYAGDSLEMEDLIEAPAVVALQYDGVIAGANKVLLTDNYLYVQDKKSVALLQFDPRGRFIRQIGKKGEGPGEYPAINDFAIDSLTNHVFVISLAKMALLEFSKEGKIIREQKMPFFGSEMALLPAGFLFFMNSNANDQSGSYELIATDRNLKIDSKMLGYFDTPDYSTEHRGLIKGPGEMLTVLNMSDTIYGVNAAGNATFPKYFLDFSPKVFPNEYRVDFGKSRQYSMSGNYDSKTGPYFETQDLFVFHHVDDRTLRMGFYHRPSGRLFDTGINFKKGNSSLTAALEMHLMGTDKDRLIASFSPEDLNADYLKASKSKLIQEMQAKSPEKHKLLFFTLKFPR